MHHIDAIISRWELISLINRKNMNDYADVALTDTPLYEFFCISVPNYSLSGTLSMAPPTPLLAGG